MRTWNFVTAVVVATALAVPTQAQVSYSQAAMAHAEAVQGEYEESLLSVEGVQGVGIAEADGQPAILILTDPETLESELPGSIDTMPVVVKEVGIIVAEQMNLGTSAGNNILCAGFCDVGTSGYKVCDNNNLTVGGWVTNNHVAASGCPNKCPNLAPLGTNMFSPGLVDAPTVCSQAGLLNVGTLNRFVNITLDGVTNNQADAAFVQATDQQVTNTIQTLGVQGNSVVAAVLGQAICKNGRTTGLTCGAVTGVNMTINVNYGTGGVCGTGRFNNAVMYSPTLPFTDMSQGGDSGSAIVDGNNNAVALHFAGSGPDGFGSPAGTVFNLLQVSLCADIPEPPTADADGPYSAECGGSSTALALDGAGSSDPDPGDVLSFSWTTDCPGGSFDDSTSATPTLTVDTGDTCQVNCSVELTVTDTTGQTDADSSTVSISDTTAPDIICPADITIECDESTAPANTGTAGSSDVCDPTVSVGFSDSVTPGACADESTIERTWTATDSCGNASSCVQTITVVDTTAPVIQCNAPAEITPRDAPISFTATASDNCDGDPVVEITGFDCFNFTKKGKRVEKTRSCVIDVSGDTISIVDSGGVGDDITWDVSATDNCGNTSVVQCGLEVIRPGRNNP